jgi:hypothetical protein
VFFLALFRFSFFRLQVFSLKYHPLPFRNPACIESVANNQGFGGFLRWEEELVKPLFLEQ